MPVINPEGLVQNRVRAIQEFHNNVGIPRAQLDVSGGIDSAVMLALLQRALGKDNITAVYSGIQSSQDSKERAQSIADSCEVPLIAIDLSSLFSQLIHNMYEEIEAAGLDIDVVQKAVKKDPSILGSIRSCLRAPIGRGFNRMRGGGIRHGTGNECEDRWLRFYQKGGDGEVDSNPIDMLAKGEVYQLAHHLKVPNQLITALPSPDLHESGEAHNDEDELKALTGLQWSYSRIDETGNYRLVGTIESMSRFLDQPASRSIFASATPSEKEWQAMSEIAKPYFAPLDAKEVLPFLRSCRHLEASTRHKLNPNCPSLGSRAELLEKGILSDELPTIPLFSP